MRIALFVGTFPVVSETFILRQVTGLRDMGHEIDIFAETRPDRGRPVQPEVSNYRLLSRTTYMDLPPDGGYWEMPVLPLTGKTWLPGSSQPVLNIVRVLRALPLFMKCLVSSPALTRKVLTRSEYGYQARSLSALYRLGKLLSLPRRRMPYSVIHAHFGPVANSFRFAKRLWGAPLVVSFHGYDFAAWPRKSGHPGYGALFATADAITANSSYTANELLKLGCPARKLHKLPMGVELRDLPFSARTLAPGETVRVLTVGRLVEKKGIEYGIRAIEEVRKQYANIRYDVIGDGPLRGQVTQLVTQLGLEMAINMHGEQNSDYVQRLMSEAHIFMLPSVTAADGDQEGQGLVLQEAQAHGLPVVATDHNGFPESILPGLSGFLVPERDVPALAERLGYLIGNPHLWANMGRRGRDYVEEKFDSDKLNHRLAELYRHAINEYWGNSVMRDT
ncbi:MAG TPA: glycosyltransferase [Chloroflexia bacterium]|nr:glycosyltransferase [Chloroflexia bacterium]